MTTFRTWLALALCGLASVSCSSGDVAVGAGDASVSALAADAPATVVATTPDRARSASAAPSLTRTRDGQFAAHNAGQRFDTVIDAKGAHVAASGAAWSLDLRLARTGRARALGDAATATPRARVGRVELERGGATEWFEHDARGLEHGFDLANRPPGEGELRLEIATAGLSPLLVEHGARVDLRDDAGRVALSYGELAVKDADGRAVPASFGVEASTIVIRVRDAAARYPLAVDPLLWGEQFVFASPFSGADFGTRLAVASDTAIIAAPYVPVGGTTGGHAVVYVRNGASWPTQQTLHGAPTKYTNKQDYFGGGLALVGDTALIGAPGQQGSTGGVSAGVTYAFGRSAGVWTQLQVLELPTAEIAGGNDFGSAISMSPDGNTAVIGAYGTGTAAMPGGLQGAAHVFVRSAGTWTRQAKLVASDPAISDQFGNSVAVGVDVALVGASQKANGANAQQGAVYYFTRDATGTWTQRAKLLAADGLANHRFGGSLAVSGTTALIGAPGKSAAYVYLLGATSATLQAELTGLDSSSGDDLGVSVALTGDTAIVGADGQASYKGAAYAFTRSGTTWSQLTKLTHVTGAANDEFGSTVGINTPTQFLIGARNAYAGNGEAYAFAYAHGNGDACALSSDCVSGFCVDGVCCDAACAGACQACSAVKKGSGADGACGTIADGADPDKECAPQACSGSTQANAFVCNGAGACRATTNVNCSPYLCGATACKATCATDGDCVSTAWCSGTTCVPKTAQGGTCSATNQCLTGNCVDGYCCNAACVGTCQACAAVATGQPNGTCASVQDGKDLRGDCPGGSCTGSTYTNNVCNGIGACRANTLSCAPFVCNAAGTACAGSCSVDGGCSAGSFCLGTTCTPKKSKGLVCASNHECVSAFCVDGVCCDGACTGLCLACSNAKKGVGADGTCGAIADGVDPDKECSGQTCNGATQENGHVCNGTGACRVTSSTACAPYACSGSACKPSCTTDVDCDGNSYCRGMACAPKLSQGATCTGKNQCQSGACVDGVCCSSACVGACQACVASATGKSDGTCAPVTDGTDFHGDCPGGSCTAATYTNNVCNGAGACRANSVTCAPFTCNAAGTACAKTCSVDGDCSATSYCAAGACTAKKSKGLACGAGDECTSGDCVDGVCCDAACNGLCQACSNAKKGAGADGTCGPVVDGIDPDKECPGQTCSGSTQENGHVCNGSGSCRSTSTSACAPFACGASACKPSCSTDADCDATAYCKGTTCTGRSAQGAACTAADQCQSGACVDGVCCNTACAGTCQACVQSATGQPNGTCGPVNDGKDVHADCPGASCTGTTLTSNVCDGTGKCRPSTSSCAPYACDASGSICAKACKVDGDCGATGYCAADGTCVGKKARAATCADARECGSGYCADGVCCDQACTGQCQACGEPSSAGTCIAVKGKPRTPRTDCAGSGTTCGGQCDGTNIAACAYATADQSCGTGCVDARHQACDGAGSCLSASVCPGNLACDGATKCKTACATSADCVSGYTCDGADHKCKAISATCSADGTSSIPADASQPPKPCGAYRCNPSSGDCFPSCTSTDDCAAGSSCSGGVCQSAPVDTNASGGCSVDATPGGAGAKLGSLGWLGALGLAAAVARRRRRQG